MSVATSNCHYDVVIAGGGPGGSTTGSLLRKYDPGIRVLIAERAKFPREHVGETQLPPIGAVLNEMGVWETVEAANFPIKIGVTFLWGQNPELWDFNLYPPEDFVNEARPAPYAGQRRSTALQVERATYDNILLEHAAKMGCEVRQQTGVDEVLLNDDTITGLKLSDGSTVTADHYVDASGNAAVIRRALNIPVDCPTFLKNIAIWDYWENTDWADTIGVGATRAQIITVGFGWLWFIPLGPTRTSLGLVCPVEYYKSSGKTPEELYVEAIARSERITGLTKNGTREGKIRTTNDWSYVSERTTGPNWFLVGETAGFADPILSAGLTLTQVGAREAAYTILAIRRQEHDPVWLKSQYHDNQIRRVRQHMRFAEFWYAANGQLTDLQNHCAEIAKTSGLTMNAKQAWAWLAQGGFTNDVLGQAGIGGLTLSGMMSVTQIFTQEDVTWQASDHNIFRLNMWGADRSDVPFYYDGKIQAIACYFRDGKRLPMTGMFKVLVDILGQAEDIQSILGMLAASAKANSAMADFGLIIKNAVQALEVMVSEGWVTAKLDPNKPRLNIATPKQGAMVRDHVEYHEGVKG